MTWTLKIIGPDGGHAFWHQGKPVFFRSVESAKDFIRSVKISNPYELIVVPVE
jgi:hypothetical protein